MKRAIIVGHTGQDGTYLQEILKKENYVVSGISRSSCLGIERNVNILEYREVVELVKQEKQDEIYFLAAVHHSSSDKVITDNDLFSKSLDVNVKSLINFLEAIRLYSPFTKMFYAGSSHIFGNPSAKPQDELTPMNPNCIYGITKTAGINTLHYYKESYNLFTAVGIFYNHESPLRESKYVSKKIIETAVAIKRREKDKLILGDLKSEIDWGYAPDYMQAVYQLMQLHEAEDFIISSGELHTIQEFVEGAFTYLGLDWRKYVTKDPSLITKKQKRNLFGNNTMLKEKTGWEPSVNFKELINILVEAELRKYDGK